MVRNLAGVHDGIHTGNTGLRTTRHAPESVSAAHESESGGGGGAPHGDGRQRCIRTKKSESRPMGCGVADMDAVKVPCWRREGVRNVSRCSWFMLMNGTTQAINLARGAVDKVKSGRDQKSDYEGVTVGGATIERRTATTSGGILRVKNAPGEASSAAIDALAQGWLCRA